MSEGPPKKHSVFDHRTTRDIYEEIRDVYRRYPQPWVIGYSGGKDFTTVVPLVWKALVAVLAREWRDEEEILQENQEPA